MAGTGDPESGMSPLQKAVLIGVFLTTGSINTLTKKWQFDSCGPTLGADDQTNCPVGQKQFHKPWTQNIQMFIGESLLIWFFCINTCRARASARNVEVSEVAEGTQERKKATFWIFLLPACCDILGTGVGGVGMLYISASVWQMMRGSLIVFTAVWSKVFLKRSQDRHVWLAVVIVCFGLFLIGCSAILDEGNSSASSNVPLGVFLTCISQAFAAFQMVVEEVFVKKLGAPGEQVVGSEGVWGIIMMVLILAVMYNVPGNDDGSYENVIDSMHMLVGSSELIGFILFYLVSIAIFNFCGVMIAGKLSAVTRTINDAMRTMIIWGVELIVFYCIDKRFGSGWSAHTYLQVIGFVLLLVGNAVKAEIVKVPGCTHAKAPVSAEEPLNAPEASQGPQAGFNRKPTVTVS